MTHTVVPPEAPRRPGQLASAITTLSLISRRMFKERMASETWAAKAACVRPATACSPDRPARAGLAKRVSDQIAHDPSDIVTVVDILERAASSPAAAIPTTGAATR